MSLSRQCSRSACRRPAVATLTYVYSDSTAVVGPLATHAEPHTYDLCAEHADGLTAPRGWDIVRLAGDYREAGSTVEDDDLLAIAQAVREPRVPAAPAPAASPISLLGSPPVPNGIREVGRRGHLRVLTDTES